MYTYTCIYIDIFIYIDIDIYIFLHTHVHLHIACFIYLCIYVCVYLYLYIIHVLIPHLLHDLHAMRMRCVPKLRNVLNFSTQGDLPLRGGGQSFHGVEDLRKSEEPIASISIPGISKCPDRHHYVTTVHVCLTEQQTHSYCHPAIKICIFTNCSQSWQSRVVLAHRLQGLHCHRQRPCHPPDIQMDSESLPTTLKGPRYPRCFSRDPSEKELAEKHRIVRSVVQGQKRQQKPPWFDSPFLYLDGLWGY